jgi:hypothetical protein
MPEEFKVDTAHLGGDGLSPHYEYAVFESHKGSPLSKPFDNEHDAKEFMEGVKEVYPNSEFFVYKRLKLAWEPVEEDEE